MDYNIFNVISVEALARKDCLPGSKQEKYRIQCFNYCAEDKKSVGGG
jgi:hypothetical protein